MLVQSIDWKDGTENRMKSSELMRESNPSFILRNWIAQDAIDAAEKGNYSEVNLTTVIKLIQK